MVIYLLHLYVDEFLENYRELHDWVLVSVFLKIENSLKTFVLTHQTQELQVQHQLQDVGKVGKSVSDSAMFSDATLTVLSNKNNPIVEVRFSDMYPVSLGALEFSQNYVEYITVQADFTYQIIRDSSKTIL